MNELRLSKPKAGRIAALDYGMARIGFAVSDEQKIIATPIAVIKAEKGSAKTVAKVLHELTLHQQKFNYVLEEIIIGLPLLLSGKQGLLADEVKHFVDLLAKSTSIPLVLWDERLTTVQAERSMLESNMTRKKRSQIVDTVAAVILLQSYLDHKQIMKERAENSI
jgi:putative Holliday junction resolvase